MPRSFRQVKTNGEQPIIAVDFDGVINTYEEGFQGIGVFSDPIPGAVGGLKALKAMGYIIDINTCRGEVDLIEAYLEKHNIPYDAVNAHLKDDDGYMQNPHKIVADLYIDDRGIRFSGSWLDTVQEVESFKLWYDQPKKNNFVGNRARYEAPVDEASNYLKHTTLPHLEAIRNRLTNSENPEMDEEILNSIIDNINSLARLTSNI